MSCMIKTGRVKGERRVYLLPLNKLVPEFGQNSGCVGLDAFPLTLPSRKAEKVSISLQVAMKLTRMVNYKACSQ